MPTNKSPWDEINASAQDYSKGMWDQINNAHTQTSTLTPAQAARQHLARGMNAPWHGAPTTPEQVKAHPASPTNSHGPFGGEYGISELQNPANFPTAGEVFSSVGSHALSAFTGLLPKIPTSPLEAVLPAIDPFGVGRSTVDGISAVQNTVHKQLGSGASPVQAAIHGTLASLPFGSTVNSLTAPLDASLGNRPVTKKNNLEASGGIGDLAGQAATVGAFKALPPTLRAIIPPDLAKEHATRAARVALGVGPEDMHHGATPDQAILHELEGGLVTRSEGRFLKKITASKAAEFEALKKDLGSPAHQTNYADPMQSINPVLEDIDSRTMPGDKTKIAEFRALVTNKVRDLSSGDMQLNPSQLVDLKRWLDDMVGEFKDDPTSTTKNIAQKAYGAIRQQLNTIAPEVTVRSQRIQSLINAEDALNKKIWASTAPSKTWFEAVNKHFLAPLIESTPATTGRAAFYKMLSGDTLARPPVPVTGVPPTPPAMQPPAMPEVQPSGPPPIRGLLPSAPGFTTTPQGTTMPSLDAMSGMAGGMPEMPRVVTPAPASGAGAPTNIDKVQQGIQAGQHYLGELQSGARQSGVIPSESGGPPTKPITPTFTPAEPPTRTQQHAQDVANLDKIVKEEVAKSDKPNLVLKDEAARRKQQTTTSTPVKPTHIQEGTQVSGIDEQGNLTSGNLEKLYPVVVDGKPTWKGVILDVHNGRTVDLPTDSIFDRLSGPPKNLLSTKPRSAATKAPPAPVSAKPKVSKLDDLLAQFDEELPEAEDTKQAELERLIKEQLDDQAAQEKALKPVKKLKKPVDD